MSKPPVLKKYLASLTLMQHGNLPDSTRVSVLLYHLIYFWAPASLVDFGDVSVHVFVQTRRVLHFSAILDEHTLTVYARLLNVLIAHSRAEHLSARHLLVQHRLIMWCSHALECNNYYGDFPLQRAC